jgi:lipopolysaccharide biosynthesis glycosyltransferase
VNAPPIAIACGVGGAYALPLSVTLRSLIAHASPGRRIDFYIFDGGLSTRDRARLESTVLAGGISLTWLRPDHDRVRDLPAAGGMHSSTYFRLLLDTALPDSLTKVIWLDADLLVVHDIAELDALDPGRHPVLAAQDMVIPYVSCPLGVFNWRTLGLPADQPLFNAGVMVIDLDRWRREQISTQAFDYLRRHASTIALWDQEALNAVLAGRWSALDERWNAIASVAGRRFHQRGKAAAAIRRSEPAWIHHFAGDWKPWTLPYGRHPYGLFYKVLDETPWAGWRPRASISSRLRSFYHEHLRDVLYPLETRYTRFRYGRLTHVGR